MIEQPIRLQDSPSRASSTIQSTMIDILFRGTLVRLSWQDIDTLLNCWQQWWSVFYQIGLFDVRDTCIRTGFQGRNLQITLKEYDELSQVLQEAYLQFEE